jgi:hypothetical protein
MTPTEVLVAFWKSFWWLVLIALAAIGLVLGMWQAGWWFAGQNATKSYQIQQEGTNNQETTRANITQWFGNLTQENVQLTEAQQAKPFNPTLVGQIKVELASQADNICAAADQISGVPLPADQGQFVKVNCQDGVVISTSPYFIPGAV